MSPSKRSGRPPTKGPRATGKGSGTWKAEQRAAKAGGKPGGKRSASKAAPAPSGSGRSGGGRGGGARGRPTGPEPERGAPSGPRPRAQRGLGGDQVEGRQAVRELLLAGRRKVTEVWVASDQDEAVVLDDIAELAMSVNVPVRDVSRSKLFARARTEAPQGVLALARELPEVDLDELVATRPGAPAPFLLALDGVTDPGNLGALLRSAETAGVSGVVLPRHRAVHITPTVTKAAAGAIEYLPMTLVGGLPAAMQRLQREGIRIIGLDGAGPVSLFDVALDDEPVMLVMGAEGKGLSRLVRQRCDDVVAIPLGGHLGSLNVAAAGALACFEVTRRRHARG